MTTPFVLSDALMDEIAELHPIQATFSGVPGHDHRWDDLSPAGVSRASERVRHWRARVAELPPQSERWGKLAVAVMVDWLEGELESFEHRDHFTDLNSIASTFQGLRLVFDSMDTETLAGWENIAARLEGLEGALEGYRASLAAGLAAGEVVAARQVRACVAQGRVHQGDTSYFSGLARAFAESGLGPSTDGAELCARIEAGAARARAAYGAFADWLETTYLPHAPHEDGVGRPRYLREMRRWLGSTPDPEETYAWGWTEVLRISQRLAELGKRIAPGKSIPDLIEHVRSDATLAAPDRESLLRIMRERQASALMQLDRAHFDVPACIRQIDVKLAPAGGPLGAYYTPPSEDFSRAGTVWYSLEGDGPFPLYDQISTAYHEGFPGHHLQCGLQVSFTANLCRLHRIAYGYSGFAEGWALYVERLMGELGYYERPEYELGMLVNELLRACRVVFDIGAHLGLRIPNDAPFHPGEAWTFDLGVEMMHTLGGLTPEHAASEVTRYLGWPAQAISYKVGERAMLALRDEHRAQGGELKDFHAKVLACGNVGLDLLRAQVFA